MESTTNQTYEALKEFLTSSAPWLVGIVNITPDSFSDGGLYQAPSLAIERIEALVTNGANIIELGAEATGPGSSKISVSEEIKRLSDILKQLRGKFFFAVDTYKAATADYCLEHGAKMINDVSALRADPDMRYVIKDHNAFIVLIYSKENGISPHVSNNEKHFEDVIVEISEFLERRINFALDAGIAQNQIIIDPGMGQFLSADPKYSWTVLRELERLRHLSLSFPMMIGTSRKGFLGGNVEQRDPVSQLTALIAHLKGASLIRTHNISMAKQFFNIWEHTGLDPEMGTYSHIAP